MMKDAIRTTFVILAFAGTASAQVPAGGEFRVNTYTTNYQDDAAVGMAPDGRFVISWKSSDIDGSSYAAMGQRHAAPGTAQGANFQVNTYTTNRQGDVVAVAVARDGGFVVVWESFGQEGAGGFQGIFGQRYDASGSRLGGEFQVNTYTTSYQFSPSVAIAPNRSFVVIWGSYLQVPGGAFDTFAQRFDAAGNRLGGEFRVNTYTTGNQFPARTGPGVAIDASGSFVVVWSDSGDRDGSQIGVFAQRFSSSGTPLGGEFQVNTYTRFDQFVPTVAAASNGNFTVAWESYSQDGSLFGVFGQRFGASGSRLGSEFQVNTYTTGSQRRSTVTADALGNFVVVWESYAQDGSSNGVMARRFASNGNARGAEFRVNTYTRNDQEDASIASDTVGNFVVAWDSYYQDDTAKGLNVFGQRFGGLQPAALRVNIAGNGVIEPGESNVDVRPSWRNVNGAAQTFGGGLSNFTGPAGATYTINTATASYGTVPNGASAECPTCYAVSVSNPAPRPVQHWDTTADELITPDAQGQNKRWTLHVGDSFTDMPTSSGYYRFVETLLHYSITGGCGGTNYCPASFTTREQMAVFVLIAKEGTGYVPPACTTPVFNDVPASSGFCRFIEELARRGVVGGCGGGNYCPTQPVTREQMAVFALRTLDPALVPPACAPPNIYFDVPETSVFCPFIEELTNRAVVTGCGGGNYCPAAALTREQMAVFISVTFGLTLYGP